MACVDNSRSFLSSNIYVLAEFLAEKYWNLYNFIKILEPHQMWKGMDICPSCFLTPSCIYGSRFASNCSINFKFRSPLIYDHSAFLELPKISQISQIPWLDLILSFFLWPLPKRFRRGNMGFIFQGRVGCGHRKLNAYPLPFCGFACAQKALMLLWFLVLACFVHKNPCLLSKSPEPKIEAP